jgi:hypothetical protein
MAVMLVLLMEEIYEMRILDELRWHASCTMSRENWYRHSNNIKVSLQQFEGL